MDGFFSRKRLGLNKMTWHELLFLCQLVVTRLGYLLIVLSQHWGSLMVHINVQSKKSSRHND